jgi:hypothetical protein
MTAVAYQLGSVVRKDNLKIEASCCTIIGNNNVITGDRNTINGNNLKISGNGNNVYGANVSIKGDGNSCSGDNNYIEGDGNAGTGTNLKMKGKNNSNNGKMGGLTQDFFDQPIFDTSTAFKAENAKKKKIEKEAMKKVAELEAAKKAFVFVFWLNDILGAREGVPSASFETMAFFGRLLEIQKGKTRSLAEVSL